jgi:metallophosphoesterase (TIGR03767 family)
VKRSRLLAVLACLAAFGGTARLGPAAGSAALDCGPTTLQGTVVDANADGILECGPGRPLVVREELAQASRSRFGRRAPLTTFFSLADFQFADEESPLRGEWADKCGDPPTESAFRPHETMVGQMMNAHVLAANRIAAGGSPVLGRPFDFAVALGDLADNQHYNETRFFIDLLDGGKLVDPDSGADGYDGVQSADPEGSPDHPLTSPVEGERILDLANEPFWASGLRNGDGSLVPWYSLMGNHDMKVQGTVADDNPTWRAFVRAYAVGGLKVMDLAPDKQQEACQGGFTDPEFWMELAASPGATRPVPADAERKLLDRADWIKEHFTTTGVPVGHGFAEPRCPSDSPPQFARACYSWDLGRFRFIGLDTNAAEGLEDGNIDEAQFEWLEHELKSVSRSYYDEAGNRVGNEDATDRLVVIVAHHPNVSLHNTGPRSGSDPGTRGQIYTAEDLEELLLRFPNVILQVDGHTHRNKIWMHQDEQRGTAYWEVNTSAVADYPTQSRTIEIADNRDGTLSIFAVTFDAAAPPNPRVIGWTADDMTRETALGGAHRDINENWLASVGREVELHDPQGDFDRLGEPEDRNVELLIRAPFRLRSNKRS